MKRENEIIHTKFLLWNGCSIIATIILKAREKIVWDPLMEDSSGAFESSRKWNVESTIENDSSEKEEE